VTALSPSSFRGMNAAKILAALGAVTVAVALLTPEAPGSSEGGRSAFSTGPGGVGIAFELAKRTGWLAERRIDSLPEVARDTVVHMVIAPRMALGAHEVRRLLDNVRRGGALVFTLDGADELADSIGVDQGRPSRFLEDFRDAKCPAEQSLRARALVALPPEVRGIVWKKPRPAGATTVVHSDRRLGAPLAVAEGFPLGRGRVVVVSTSAIFANDAVRTCEWGADVAVARILEYVRSSERGETRIVFDEYHHGFGAHPGTVSAIGRYLGGTASGHFVTQAMVAGLLLLLSAAPRPVVPRDPERIARRSPLDHADALGHAYADVGATRTAAQRLVSGLRRRAGRTVPVGAGADDDVFFDGVAMRQPSLAPQLAVIRRALREPIPDAELIAVGDAVRAVEQQLMSPPQRTQ